MRKLNITPLASNKYMLLTDFTIISVTVPAQYITNGANIPRWLWWIVPPFNPRFMEAIVVHDYLCFLEEYKEADNKFEEILLQVENSFVTRSMVRAVRLYHHFKYNIKG